MLRYSCPAAESTSISTIGIGYSSFGVATLKSLRSMQTLKVSFFLTTGTILTIHSTYLAVWMKLHLRSLSTSSLIFDRTSGAKLLGVYLMGFFPVFMGSFSLI